MTKHKLQLVVLPGLFAVCRLDKDAPVPMMVSSGNFFSITRTADELSVVCVQNLAPNGARCEGGWLCLRVVGTMDFSMIGVVASLVTPLAEAGIGVFVVSTFDTDYVLVKERDFEKAVAAFHTAGHSIQKPPTELHPMQYSEYMAMTQRDDDSFSSAELVAAYEQGIEELRSAVAGMTPDHILARPIPGKWNTQEVVSRLADTEINYTDRIERTIALERPLLMGVDERPYPERLNYQAFDMTEQLDLFTALRRHGTRILRMQPAETWQRTAVHSETGLVTLRQLVFQAVRHVRHHLPFIAEKRAALEGTKP